jgi:thioredoxin 1
MVAIVGLSKDPSRESYDVAKFLKSRGYHIVPINPSADQILGEKSYPSLLDLPEEMKQSIEIVDIFRRPEDVPPIVDQAIELRKKYGKPHVIWMQLDIVNEEAAKKGEAAGLTVIMNHCMRIERQRLDIEEDNELEQIRAKKKSEMITQMSEKEDIGPGNSPIVLDDAHFNETVQKYPLMLIDCWAEWCGPCRMVAPAVDELARDYSGRLVVGKLNVDDNPQTANQFGIMSIPTLLIMKNGSEVDRMVGAFPKNLIEDKLKQYL